MVWNSLSFHFKSENNLQAFEEVIKFWAAQNVVAVFALILVFICFMIFFLLIKLICI